MSGSLGTLEIKHNGSGDLVLTNLRAKILNVRYACAGNITMKDVVVAETLSLVSSGTGNVKGNGNAKQLTIESRGNADVALEGLTAVDCNVTNSGNGKVKVRVTGSLHAKTQGLGDIIYYGTPQDVKAESAEQSWLGKVKKGVEK